MFNTRKRPRWLGGAVSISTGLLATPALLGALVGMVLQMRSALAQTMHRLPLHLMERTDIGPLELHRVVCRTSDMDLPGARSIGLRWPVVRSYLELHTYPVVADAIGARE